MVWIVLVVGLITADGYSNNHLGGPIGSHLIAVGCGVWIGLRLAWANAVSRRAGRRRPGRWRG